MLWRILNIEILNGAFISIVSVLPGVDDDMVLHVGHVQTTIDNLEVELSIYQDDTPLSPTSLSVTAIL